MTDLIKRDDALAAIEDVMVRRIKFHQDMKRLASTGQGQRREHNRMHALSEAFGEIKKNTSALPAVTVGEPTEAQDAKDIAEAKLAECEARLGKAVEALREILSGVDIYPWRMAREVLVELEGKE